MTDLTQRFLEPAFLGQGGRKPAGRFGAALAAVAEDLAAWRRDLRLRRDLSKLDARLLRDIGLERDPG